MYRFEELNVFFKLLLASLITALAWLARDALEAGVVAAFVLGIIAVARLPQSRGYYKVAALVCSLATLAWWLNFVLDGVASGVALDHSLRLAFRIVATTGGFFVAMETTSPGSLLGACSAARLPSMITLVLALVVGLIPLIREEYDRISDTQRARGLEIDRGPLLRRIRYALAKGVPLMVQTYRAAEAIGLSLSLYGFDTSVKRTTWRLVRGVRVESSLMPTAQKQPLW